MKAFLVLSVLVAGCGSEPCANADGHLDNLGICLVNSKGQDIISEDDLNQRMAAAVSIFNRLDNRPDEPSRDRRYFDDRRTSIAFDSSAVEEGHSGTFFHRDDGSYFIAVEEGMSVQSNYYVLSHEMVHLMLDRWRGDPGSNHPAPYFDTSISMDGWDSKIFNCIWPELIHDDGC
jgi:hypothetical protein